MVRHCDGNWVMKGIEIRLNGSIGTYMEIGQLIKSK